MASISGSSGSSYAASAASRFRQNASNLFALGNSSTSSSLPTSIAQSKQARTTSLLQARQLAVTAQLGQLRTTLARAQFIGTGGSGVPDYQEIREDRFVDTTKQVERTQNIYARQDILSLRDITEERPVYETRDITETRDIFETRDVYETRDVFEDRDIIETRPVYEQQPTYATAVDGTRDLSSYSRVSQAGIDVGADLSVTVGGNAAATIRFTSSSRIAVIVGGTTTNFNFTANNGSWRTALTDALNSVTGLNASYDAGGRLSLSTDNAESLTIADVANGFLDFSGSPLADLGLVAGTTGSHISGYQQVQTGTEDVVVGTESVLVGTEDVLVGTEDVMVGTEDVVVGSEQVQIGTETVVTGQESYVSGQQDVVVGTKKVTETVAGEPQLQSFVVGFARNFYTSGGETELTSSSRRDVRERALALKTAIGPAEITAGVDNPFASMTGSLGLDRLAAMTSAADRDLAITKIDAALKALAKLTTGSTSTTGGLASLALSGSSTSLGSGSAYGSSSSSSGSQLYRTA